MIVQKKVWMEMDVEEMDDWGWTSARLGWEGSRRARRGARSAQG